MIQVSKSDCQIPNHDFETVLADGNLSNWGNIFLYAIVIDSAGNQFAGIISKLPQAVYTESVSAVADPTNTSPEV